MKIYFIEYGIVNLLICLIYRKYKIIYRISEYLPIAHTKQTNVKTKLKNIKTKNPTLLSINTTSSSIIKYINLKHVKTKHKDNKIKIKFIFHVRLNDVCLQSAIALWTGC